MPAPFEGTDLASRIAKVYRNTPPQQGDLPSQEDDQNLELDRTFEQMIQMQKVRGPEQESPVQTFPARKPLPAARADENKASFYTCAECGRDNPPDNQFCGMCGAAREGAVVLAARAVAEPQSLAPRASIPSRSIKHQHRDRYRTIAYLLVAVVLLLVGVIGWQQGREHRKVMSVPVGAPPVQPRPTPVQPQPAPALASPAAGSVPAVVPAEVKPARKPSVRSIRPAAARRAAPPATTSASETAAPIVANPPMPKLPEFSHTPPPLDTDRR